MGSVIERGLLKMLFYPISNLIEPSALECEHIYSLFDLAKRFKIFFQKRESIPLLQGMGIVNLFFENSTRTRTSFEVAIRQLQGNVINFSLGTSSVQKGETLLDTAKNLLAMAPHAFILRHSASGSAKFLEKHISVPIINAGDGMHAHPTQALLDAFTIQEKIGSLEGKQVLIIGDVLHSRVARSNIIILKKLGAKITVCGPGSLLFSNAYFQSFNIHFTSQLEDVLPEADVIMVLRMQLERQNRLQVPSCIEYSHFWGMTREREKILKKNTIILHPGPVNRGIEVDPEVIDGPRSMVLEQVCNGIVIRMAVLGSICNPSGVTRWLEKKTE